MPGSAFTVAPNGGAPIAGTATAVTYPAANQTRFTLSAPVHHSTCSRSATRPAVGNRIRDLAVPIGNVAADGTLANASITNNTADAAPTTPALVPPLDGQFVNSVTPR